MNPSNTYPPALYKGPTGRLVHRCAALKCEESGDNMLQCTGCHVVRYCTKEHQVAHRPRHKSMCNTVKKQRSELAEEEGYVRNGALEFMAPPNAFESDVGHFWSVMSTRDYLRARFALANHLQVLGTLDSVKEALDHMVDLLRLEERDTFNLLDIIPTLLLRLDRDQECYDVLKYCVTERDGQEHQNSAMEDEEDDFDLEGTLRKARQRTATKNRNREDDKSKPLLGLKMITVNGGDVLEDPARFWTKDASYARYTTFVLLKLKLIVDIVNIKRLRAKAKAAADAGDEKDAAPTPEDSLEAEKKAVRSPLSAKLFVGVSDDELQKYEDLLVGQARFLGDSLAEHELNEDKDEPRPKRDRVSIFTMMLDPDEALRCDPMRLLKASFEEKALAIQSVFSAFWTTEGVLDGIKAMRTVSAEKVKLLGARVKVGTSQQETDRLMWRNLKWAVADASYVGNVSKERPSRVHIESLSKMGRDDAAAIIESSD